MSLRRKFLITAISLLLLSSLSAFFGIRYFYSQFIEERFGYIAEKNTRMAARQVESMLDFCEEVTRHFARDVFILSTSLPEKKINQIQPFKEIFKMDPLVSAVRSYLPNRIQFEIYKTVPATARISQNMFSQLRDSIRYSTVHISEISGDTVFTISVPIKEENIAKAVVVFDFKMTKIFSLLKGFRGFGRTDEAYLVNEKGLMASPSRFLKDTFASQKVPAAFPLKKTENSTVKNERNKYLNYRDVKVFGNRIPIPRLHSFLYNEISEEEAFQPVKLLSKMLGWAFSLFFILMVGGVLFASRIIIEPLKVLHKGVCQIEKGNRDFKIQVGGKDEISSLAQSFERMQKKIKETEKRLKEHSEQLESIVAKRTAELDEKVLLLERQHEEAQGMAAQLENINIALHDEINEREKAEDALKRSEMRYRIVSDISSDYAYALVVEKDGSLKNLWMTGAFEKMTGYTREEIDNKGGWESLIHPEDTAISLRQVGVYLSGMSSSSEYRIIGRDGNIRWVYDTGRPEWDADEQRVKYIYGAVKDITLQKEAERELKNSGKSYRQLFDSLEDALYVQDENGLFITVNLGAVKMYGWPKEYFIGKTPEFVSAPGMNDLKKIAQAVKNAFNGKPQRFEFWGIRKNGQIFPKEVHLYSSTYFGKDVVLAYAQDISERKAAEKQVKNLTQAVEQSPVSILVLDESGHIEYANQQFTDSSGFRMEDLKNMHPASLLAKDEQAGLFDIIWKDVNDGNIWRGEILSIRKNGEEYWEEAVISPIYDEEGTVSNYIFYKKNISEQKKLEEQFRQSQKMEAVGRLAGGVAHDFNNLLTVIIGYSEVMLSQIAEEDPLYRKIKQIDKAGRRAEGLTRQLLAFSRKQIIQPKIISLNQMINDMEKMLQRLIGEHIELQTILSSEPGNLNADPSQLEQVLMNLCINARDSMPDGGTLLIYTENVHLKEADESGFYDAAPGAYIKLSISDTGTGMDEKLRAQVFEPFFTTKEKGKGTGLGLSTVYGILKQSGGSIWVESEIGKGTTFNMLFPRSAECIENEIEIQAGLLDIRGSETILVVEDEEALRALTVEMLEENGYTVLKAEDGEAALSSSIKYNNRIDLLLTDVVMPKMNGRKLAEEIIKIHPEIYILYMSGYTEDAIVHHGVLEGSTEFIPKPFKPTALLQKIRKIFNQTG